MSENNLCKISFETWWIKKYYPHEPPTYDDSIDSSNEAWAGWEAAWELRGTLDAKFKTIKS